MIRNWIRKSPRLRSLLLRGYHGALEVSERHLLGTKFQEIRWRLRRIDGSQTVDLAHPHRSHLVGRVGRFAPFESILELGCNVGPNLVALGRSYPGVRLYGLDISGRAIKRAKAVLKQESISNATAFVGSADNLRKFADKSVDVALSDATLMYVGPDKITRALSEMVRVARKGIVLNEWHLFVRGSAGECSQYYYAHWVHDYVELLHRVPGVKAVQVEKLPPGLWTDSNWSAYGALVEVQV